MVTTGSNVETRDATDGPVISIPVKSAQKATTVETIAISITAISPYCGKRIELMTFFVVSV